MDNPYALLRVASYLNVDSVLLAVLAATLLAMVVRQNWPTAFWGLATSSVMFGIFSLLVLFWRSWGIELCGPMNVHKAQAQCGFGSLVTPLWR
jgi:hypothetical protein